MNIQYVFKNMHHWEEVRMKEYAELKERSLEKLLSHFQHDEVNLQIRGERFDKNNAYEVELIMEIPGKLFIGKEASHTIEKAVDLAKDRLIGQLRRHEEQLKSKGKSFSGLKREIKETAQGRTHKSLKSDVKKAAYDSALSSEVESNPINTF